eukprot:gene16305-19393_t
MNSIFNLARRTVFSQQTRQALTRGGGGHGHGHDGPEYPGISLGVQRGLSLLTKIAGCVIFASVPFAAIRHQKNKKAAA